MSRYVVGRVLQSVLIVVLITVTVFVLMRLSAGDPARIRAPVFARPDVIEQYARDFGVDRTIVEQLASFVGGAVQGDLGQSFRFQAPVTELVARAFPRTLLLATVALAISLTLAILLGSLAARRPNSVFATVSSVIAALGQSVPVFWFGLILVLFLAVTWPILPAGGLDGASSLILPAIAVSLSILPTQLRVLRASMEATLSQEFIRTARAFGIAERRILMVYALRNAALPLITVIGVDVGYLLGGVIVAEVVFNFPGIGQLALVALNARDYPLIQGVTIVTASTFVVVNLLIDLLYGLVDPRIRLERP
jgi:ABC-type dipeptide/oligopeptide/nickel transport system permease component